MPQSSKSSASSRSKRARDPVEALPPVLKDEAGNAILWCDYDQQFWPTIRYPGVVPPDALTAKPQDNCKARTGKEGDFWQFITFLGCPEGVASNGWVPDSSLSPMHPDLGPASPNTLDSTVKKTVNDSYWISASADVTSFAKDAVEQVKRSLFADVAAEGAVTTTTTTTTTTAGGRVEGRLSAAEEIDALFAEEDLIAEQAPLGESFQEKEEADEQSPRLTKSEERAIRRQEKKERKERKEKKKQETSAAAAASRPTLSSKEVKALRSSCHTAPRGEKRLERTRTFSQAVTERLGRALSQRMFLVDKKMVTPSKGSFTVLGSTGNVYNVTIGSIVSCNCPDACKGNLCKHVIFVLCRVLGLPRTSQLIPQRAFLESELRAIFDYAPRSIAAAVDAHDDVKEALGAGDRSKKKKKQGKEAVEDDTAGDGAANEAMDDDCAICFEAMGGKSKALKLVDCQSCKKFLHKECYNQLRKHQKTDKCPLCRQVFGGGARGASADASLARRNSSGSTLGGRTSSTLVSRGSYVNAAALQPGVALQRDTSTYRRNEWLDSRYGGWENHEDDDEDFDMDAAQYAAMMRRARSATALYTGGGKKSRR